MENCTIFLAPTGAQEMTFVFVGFFYSYGSNISNMTRALNLHLSGSVDFKWTSLTL